MAFHNLLSKKIQNLGKELSEILEQTPTLHDPTLVSLFIKKKNEKTDPHIHRRLDELVNNSPEEIHNLFSGQDNPEMSNFEKLADIFAALSRQENFPDRNIYKEKAILLYEYISIQTATFSFERNGKVEALKAG